MGLQVDFADTFVLYLFTSFFYKLNFSVSWFSAGAWTLHKQSEVHRDCCDRKLISDSVLSLRENLRSLMRVIVLKFLLASLRETKHDQHMNNTYLYTEVKLHATSRVESRISLWAGILIGRRPGKWRNKIKNIVVENVTSKRRVLMRATSHLAWLEINTGRRNR